MGEEYDHKPVGEDMATEFKQLRSKFEDHLIEHRIRNKDYELRQERQDTKHEQNMEAIAKLTKATQGVVDAWSVVTGIQKFLKWVSGFAVIGVAAKFLLEHVFK